MGFIFMPAPQEKTAIQAGVKAALAVNDWAIYSNRQSAASPISHPGCFEGVFCVRYVRRCRELME